MIEAEKGFRSRSECRNSPVFQNLLRQVLKEKDGIGLKMRNNVKVILFGQETSSDTRKLLLLLLGEYLAAGSTSGAISLRTTKPR